MDLNLYPNRGEYTEAEAASLLGVTVEELRFLVQTCVLNGAIGGDLPAFRYRPSDLVVLRLLAERRAASTTAG